MRSIIMLVPMIGTLACGGGVPTPAPVESILRDASGAEVGRVTAKLAMEQAYLELRFGLGLGPVTDASDPVVAEGNP